MLTFGVRFLTFKGYKSLHSGVTFLTFGGYKYLRSVGGGGGGREKGLDFLRLGVTDP